MPYIKAWRLVRVQDKDMLITKERDPKGDVINFYHPGWRYDAWMHEIIGDKTKHQWWEHVGSKQWFTDDVRDAVIELCSHNEF